ncbi:MAG: D-alanine--D-alanine ligase [Chitinophagales bacterium]
MTEKKVIAVITGGEAAERSISLKSAAVVCDHLPGSKYEIYKVTINPDNWPVEYQGKVVGTVDCNDFSVVHEGRKIKFDAAFVALHGTPAEDGKLQGYLDLKGVPYNCCGVLTAALTFDKNKTKEYLSVFGIRSPRAVCASTVQTAHEISQAVIQQLTFPVFVKPNKNGSSYGASKVGGADELAAAISLGFQYDDEILIEEYIAGTEVTCGCIRYKGAITPLPITEIRSKKGFFDFEAKYEGASQEITPAEIDAGIAAKIQQTVAFIYRQLDFKGMCRVDFIIRDGEFFMLEVNSIPGISAESIVPQQARAFGLTLEELFAGTLPV